MYLNDKDFRKSWSDRFDDILLGFSLGFSIASLIVVLFAIQFRGDI